MNTLNTRGYGDLPNLETDITALRDILARQGFKFVVDVAAERSGEIANTFKLDRIERSRLFDACVNDLKSALSDRL